MEALIITILVILTIHGSASIVKFVYIRNNSIKTAFLLLHLFTISNDNNFKKKLENQALAVINRFNCLFSIAIIYSILSIN